jgi:hypothetical protein
MTFPVSESSSPFVAASPLPTAGITGGEPRFSVHPPDPGSESAWREVLGLWLSWNEAHEQVDARMFKAGENLHELESLLDRADEMRFEAVRRSKLLLAASLRQAG